jgi:magnesium-transporting ATPase (P-type)
MDKDTVSLRLSEGEKYTLLKVFDFDSDRKAMSVIVKCDRTGKFYCFVKGADSSIKRMVG